MRLTTILVLVLLLQSFFLHSQPRSEIFINSNSGLEKTLSGLVNELELSDEQKLVIGMIILKHALNFNYSEFEKKSDAGKYVEIRALVKEIDAEMKEVLTKKQYKIYRKKKRALKKELKGNS